MFRIKRKENWSINAAFPWVTSRQAEDNNETEDSWKLCLLNNISNPEAVLRFREATFSDGAL